MIETGPLLVDTGRGLSLKFRERWIYSRHSPESAPIDASNAAPALAETLYLIPSPCLCYGMAELLARIPPSSAALCVEAVPELAAIARERIASQGLYSPVIAPSGAIAAFRDLERSIGPARFRRVVELRLSGGRALDEGAYDAALAAIDADISTRFRNRLSLVRMGRLWTKNIIANLSAMDWNDASPLSLISRPVIVCGAGPSLDMALVLIRNHRDAVTVVACDTAAGSLARAGIVPDAVVCLEGQIYNVSDFLPLNGDTPRLVVDLSAHPSSYRAVAGQKTIVVSEWTVSAFLRRLTAAGLPISAVPPLGSVGILALRVAAQLGRPVLLSGLDFAFMQGATHCAGSPADLRERRSETRTNKRSGAWGSSFREGTRRIRGSLITDPALSMYAGLAASELPGVEAYDLRGRFGSPLPIPALSIDETAVLLESYALNARRGSRSGDDENRVTFGATVEASPDEYRRRALAFLSGELELTDAVSGALRTKTEPAELKRLLTESDFLYAHFPDPERVIALEEDALKRVAAEAAYWRGRLEAALGLSGA